MCILSFPWLHRRIIWAFVGPARISTGTLVHCWVTLIAWVFGLFPFSDVIRSSSQEADLTHSPQCTATSHMPASPEILTQHWALLKWRDKMPLWLSSEMFNFMGGRGWWIDSGQKLSRELILKKCCFRHFKVLFVTPVTLNYVYEQNGRQLQFLY